MNILDIIIAIVLIGGAIRGFQKGFFHEAATLAALVAGVFIAILFSNIAGSIISELVSWRTDVIKIVVFILLFIIAAGLIKMLGHLLTELFKAMMLGFVNKLAGLALGLIKWLVVLSVLFAIINFFDTNNQLLSEEVLSGSSLYVWIERLDILHYIIDQLPENMNLPDTGINQI